MKAKTQLLTLVSMATLTLGGVTVTSSLLLNTPENHSINAETVDDTVGTVRLWISSDQNNPISKDGGVPKLWIHTGSGTDDATKGEDYWVGAETGNWNNGQENNRTYYYFDVPAANLIGNYLTIQRFSSDGTSLLNQSGTIEITTTNVTQVFYLWENQSTISAGPVGKLDAGMAAKALEGLQTCSSSATNGYNAFEGIAKTFIHNDDGTWKIVGNLNDYNIHDYASVDAYATGERAVTVDAYSKYLALSGAAGVTF